jgi:hypothetical protein
MVRKVSSIEQVDVEEVRYLYLYEEKIVSQFREFPIQKVFDISYRMIRGNIGFLYLHTSKGVFSYNIKKNPENFIKSVKKQIKKSTF